MKTSEQSDRRDEARTAGRGLIYIAGAKAFFIVTSFSIYLVLPRLLGTPAAYGLYSKAMSFGSIINNVLIASTVLSVSKFVSERDTDWKAVLRQGLTLQLGVGTALALAVFLFAPQIGERLLRDPTVTPLLRTIAAVIFCYALYGALVGALNGRRRFLHQAGLDATFSTFRTGGILAGAAIGVSIGSAFGPYGAITGFSIAASLIVIAAFVVVGPGSSGETLPWRTWLGFMAPIWLYQACLNGILLSDVLVMAGVLAQLGEAAGLSAPDAAEQASSYVGYYSAAQKFAFVPYQLMLSMTFIVFPMVARATSTGDQEAAQRTIREALRFSVLVLVGVATPIAGAADGVMRIAYPEEYLAGSGALQVLVFGAAAFALFVISATVISGAARPLIAAAIAAVGLVVVIGGNVVLVRLVGIGENTVSAAALGTSSGMFVALFLSAVAVYRRFGTYLAPLTVLRVGFAGAAGFGAAHVVPHGSRGLAILALAVGTLAYALVLVVTRELGRRDIDAARQVLERRK
ncbi:MAG: polysaccharide biosynthesis C-terminal domain-containing protein [Myxococcota bacterium]